MSTFKTTQPQLASTKILLAVSVPLMIAIAGFVGFISYSFLPLSPSENLYDLHQRLEQARSEPLSADQAQILDRAAANLEAANLAIEYENSRSWQYRSYDRARNLLWKAEAFLDEAEARPSSDQATQAVPAG